ncbi:VWA domain-containing protein [Actinomadura vinacea]|uniref:VWA domain-containing protein n=1 Tax=Actinomadura vinacea TaxID=115336 RepID=A0ABN3JIW4_9ACTN
MTYEAEISRLNPACFVFLIDRSTSMMQSIGGGTEPKKEVVADALNRLLYTLVGRCVRESDVHDFFHVGVIGYGKGAGPILGGPLAGSELVTASELAHNPAKVKRRTRDGLASEAPVWVDALADGLTPMTEALNRAHDLLEEWVDEHPKSFPPIVLNLTDGEPTDGDPAEAGQRVRALRTSDGAALLFNLHISSVHHVPVSFPATGDGLTESGRRLFAMSSPLPDSMLAYAKELGVSAEPGSRGFVYNGEIGDIVQFLDIGTRLHAAHGGSER